MKISVKYIPSKYQLWTSWVGDKVWMTISCEHRRTTLEGFCDWCGAKQ